MSVVLVDRYKGKIIAKPERDIRVFSKVTLCFTALISSTFAPYPPLSVVSAK
jgi:hypothetical protein